VARGAGSRRARGAGTEAAGAEATPPDPRDKKIAEQEREITRWKQRAERAEALVELQKKVAALLGAPLESAK